MRKISIYALLSILSLGSCTKEFVYNDANDIKENAEKASYYSNKTLRKVQKKVGFPERIR